MIDYPAAINKFLQNYNDEQYDCRIGTSTNNLQFRKYHNSKCYIMELNWATDNEVFVQIIQKNKSIVVDGSILFTKLIKIDDRPELITYINSMIRLRNFY